MTTSRIRFATHCLMTAVGLLGALLLPASAAQANATVWHFEDPTVTEISTGPLDVPCLPRDLVGTITVTERATGQVIDTASGIRVVHGLNYFGYRLDLPDGSYVQSGNNIDRYIFVATREHTVYHQVSLDLRTIYAADGTELGTVGIHANYHIVYSDLNDNDQADPGEITVEFEHFHVHCG